MLLGLGEVGGEPGDTAGSGSTHELGHYTQLTRRVPSFDNSPGRRPKTAAARRPRPRGTRMFTIIISEKGGAERREVFDKNEINVGRVQGNDLMLPKGNVSKHHARLLFRDGRFIVTDLKSTNGTYVNGRKISQATIVREGDKIYIGDFVLRLETAAQAAAPEPAYASGDDSQGRTPARQGAPSRDALSPQPGPPPLAPPAAV